jgi:L-alanine-DL-glutamate epimerase-like enolase superfamily enzyme
MLTSIVPRISGRSASEGPSSALKLKLGEGDRDIERVAAVRAAAPNAVLLCDVNEGWSFDQLRRYTPNLQECGIQLIEQPLRVEDDKVLRGYHSPITLCADESCFDRQDLESVRHRYGAINIKLEKTGGLTEALEVAASASSMGLQVMVGCMVSTSLSIAPALLLRSIGRWFDLDGPTYIIGDRPHGIKYEACKALPPSPKLWG